MLRGSRAESFTVAKTRNEIATLSSIACSRFNHEDWSAPYSARPPIFPSRRELRSTITRFHRRRSASEDRKCDAWPADEARMGAPGSPFKTTQKWNSIRFEFLIGTIGIQAVRKFGAGVVLKKSEPIGREPAKSMANWRRPWERAIDFWFTKRAAVGLRETVAKFRFSLRRCQYTLVVRYTFFFSSSAPAFSRMFSPLGRCLPAERSARGETEHRATRLGESSNDRRSRGIDIPLPFSPLRRQVRRMNRDRSSHGAFQQRRTNR